jgi:SAM-dependent methyltransferase
MVKKNKKLLKLFLKNPVLFVNYLSDLYKFKINLNRNEFKKIYLFPCLKDKIEGAGTSKGQYFNQDLLIAQKIFQNNPVKHVDIGSRIDGFVAHVASFREIEVFDIREVENKVENIRFVQADMTSSNLIDYCDSVSSLHAIEHFGLGRYGDKLDVNGHLKGIESITKILKKGGKFYFSVPIGEPCIEFNAHRIFSIKYLLNIFEKRYNLDSFSYVDDKGDLFKDLVLTEKNISSNLNCRYGCGIFDLTKI